MDPVEIRNRVREILDARRLTPNSVMGTAILLACLRTKTSDDKSRPIAGFCVLDNTCCFRHCWVEVPADGPGWNVIDATRPEVSGMPEGHEITVTYVRESEQEAAGIENMMRVDLLDEKSCDLALRFEVGVQALLAPNGWRALLDGTIPVWGGALDACLEKINE